MYLMCPRCNSHFEMSADALGAKGRKVRCTVCSKAWRARQKDLNATLPQTAEPNAAPSPHPSSHSSAASLAHQFAQQSAHQSSSSRAASSAPAPAPPSPSPLSNIPPPQFTRREAAADRLDALTKHHRHAFTPLQFAEQSLERPLNNLLRFVFAWSVWVFFWIALFYAVRTYPIDILNRFPNALHVYERLNMSHPDFTKLLLNGRDFSMTQAKVTSEYRLSRDLLKVLVLVGNRTNEEKPAPILRGTFLDQRGEETGYFHFEPEEETLPPQGELEYSAQVDLPQPTSATLTLTLLSQFEGRLDLGGVRLKVHNTRVPFVAPSANSSSSPNAEQP